MEDSIANIAKKPGQNLVPQKSKVHDDKFFEFCSVSTCNIITDINPIYSVFFE